jgi:superfamily II DNA/RNA helicase
MTDLSNSFPAMSSGIPNGTPLSAPKVDTIKAYETFDDMGLDDNLTRGIYSYGFEQPSNIQQLAIVPMSKHTDILAQAQSGTGKTGAFTIGSLSVINTSLKYPQVLVICPTRELSQQTERVAHSLGTYMNLRVLSATGGNQLRNDIQTLKSGAQFIVGTPGRIFDLIRRGDLTLDQIKYVILDEADQMLEDLFADQIRSILSSKFPVETMLHKRFRESVHGLLDQIR